MAYDWDNPDGPRNVADFEAHFAGELETLAEAEAAFARLTARCPAG